MTRSTIRWSRQTLLAATLGLAEAAAFAAGPPPLYIATPIGSPLVAHNHATAINAGGQLAGWAWAIDFTFKHAWVEQAGILKDIGTLGGKESEANAINIHGHVAGGSPTLGQFNYRAFAYTGGALQDLGTLGGTASVAYGINDSGQVAGVATLPGDAVHRAFLYSNGTMTDLGSLGGGFSVATAINNAGQVAGWSTTTAYPNYYQHAFLYSNGVMQDLGTLAGPGIVDGVGSTATAVNASGQVTGTANVLQWGPTHAFVYSNGVMTNIFPTRNSGGTGINASGDVVGWYDVFTPLFRNAFIWSGGIAYDLNELVLNDLGGVTLTEGVAINDSGQIVARGCIAQNACWNFRLDPTASTPGVGTVVANPYGPLTVIGATLNGNTITALETVAYIQLGAMPGTPGSFAEIDFQGLDLGANRSLIIRPGAPGQTVVVRNVGAAPTVISGFLSAEGGPDTAPILHLHSPTGITVMGYGTVSAPAGMILDALGATWHAGEAIVNKGYIYGGSGLALYGSRINGDGVFFGDSVHLASFGNVNNPVNGTHYLSNGLNVLPQTGTQVALTLNGYGISPQAFNVKVYGDATVSMPSAWPAGVSAPVNNAPVPVGSNLPIGTPDPVYGGGSLIVHSTGALTLQGGASGDFAFPGGVVLVADGFLNVNGVVVNNGFTTSGKAFQGAFFESPYIMSTEGPIQVFTNDLNWVNFSSFPHVPVRTWQLAKGAFGSAQFAIADAVAPHLNTYSVVSEAAAVGGCWTCFVNPAPVDMR